MLTVEEITEIVNYLEKTNTTTDISLEQLLAILDQLITVQSTLRQVTAFVSRVAKYYMCDAHVINEARLFLDLIDDLH